MKRFFEVLFLSGLFLIPQLSYGQKTWTLEECIGYALENNIQLKRQQLQSEIAANNLLQAKINLFPSVNASSGLNGNFGKKFNQYTTSWENQSIWDNNMGVGGEVVLFNGFANITNVYANRFNMLSMIANYEKAKNDLSLNIAGTYLQVLYNKELYEIAKSQLEITKMQVEKTSKLYEVGNIAKGSLLEIKAQEATENVNITNAQNTLDLSLLTLAQLLDLDTLKNFQIADPVSLSFEEEYLPVLVDSVYGYAVENLPQIKSAEYGLKYFEKQLCMERAQLLPRLTMSGSVGTYYNKGIPNPEFPGQKYKYSDQISDNLGTNLGFTLAVPIFNKYSYRTRINNAKLNYLDAQYNLRLTQKVLYKEIEQAHTDAIGAYANYKARLDAVTASEESFKYVQQKFDVGMVNSVDYNVAKNSYTKAKSDLLQAKYQFIFRTKVLDFYRGKEIKI